MSAVVNFKAPNTASPSIGTFNVVIAQCVFTDGDTGASIVHNFGLSVLSPTTDLGSFYPVVEVNYQVAPTTTLANPMAVAWTDSNTITLTKIAQTGSACTVIAQIMRLHTFIR